MHNFTQINLEKELLKSNKKSILTSEELLQVEQYEILDQLEQNDVIQRLGLNKNLSNGKQLSQKIDKNKQDIAKFDQNRVFHISQIEKICNKYLLRFLPIKYFNGEIDAELPQKITNFEENPKDCYIRLTQCYKLLYKNRCLFLVS